MFLTYSLESGGGETAAFTEQMTAQLPKEHWRQSQVTMEMSICLSYFHDAKRTDTGDARSNSGKTSGCDTLIPQSAIALLQTEYKAVGVDLETMQRNYILVAGAKMLALALCPWPSLSASPSLQQGLRLQSTKICAVRYFIRSFFFNAEFDHFFCGLTDYPQYKRYTADAKCLLSCFIVYMRQFWRRRDL